MGKEIEVDAICDGTDILIPGIMEHIERTGIHSGDSISCLLYTSTRSPVCVAFFEDLSGKKSGLVSVLCPGGSLFYALVLYNLVFQSDDLVLLCGDRCLWNFLRDKK